MTEQFENPGPVEAGWSDAISSVEEIIEDARNGRMFILVDHEDRENEGDLVIPAQWATPDAINFMAMHGRGLICLSMTFDADRPAGPAVDVHEQFLAP
jgi:3,4-dihydroxy 2-butanone 4-phosphate synthase/GTP cyclohydrolase II